MFTIKNTQTEKQPMQAGLSFDVPDSVYVKLSTERTVLLGSTVRAEDELGNKVGGGYINSIRECNGNRYVSVRLLINGLIYTGSVNWDETRFCKISISNHNLEALL